MSQHKKQAKPTIEEGTTVTSGIINWSKHDDFKVLNPNPFTITDPSELTKLLKAIYRDGANGTSRSLSKDVQAITDLFNTKQETN